MANKLEEVLMQNEGVRLKPYKCTEGYLTIGIGRNIESVGISDKEALYLLRNDIKQCKNELKQFDWYFKKPVAVQHALIRMCFNLGLTKLLKFKRMIKALESQDYNLAAYEALDSKWAKQVGQRARDISEQIKSAATD